MGYADIQPHWLGALVGCVMLSGLMMGAGAALVAMWMEHEWGKHLRRGVDRLWRLLRRRSARQA